MSLQAMGLLPPQHKRISGTISMWKVHQVMPCHIDERPEIVLKEHHERSSGLIACQNRLIQT